MALRSGGIEPWIVVTKLDTLANDKAAGTLRAELEPWEKAGLAVHWTAAPLGTGIDVLRATLAGKVAVVLGHSGVGKSTLVNALDPAAQQRTGAVRAGDDKGRHTTTASRLIPFVAGGALVDTPGIRQLAPDTRDVVALARSIPELAPYLDGCRYVDCSHAGEPGCRVQAAAASHPRVAGALKRLQRLVDSMNEP